MARLLRAMLLLFLLSQLPMNALAAEELHAIKEKASTGKFYERALYFFTKKIPEAFEKQLENSQKYIDVITEVFTEEDIPLDIAYLPLIESGFSPLSVGRGDAVGLWQLVKSTGRKYGLKIDKYVDERKDPVKSTYAAAKYLNDLHRIFGAWDVALAAYNAGAGKIKRIAAGRSFDLPEVINRYLAKFMAASTVAQNPEKFGIEPPETLYSDYMDYIEITTEEAVSLQAIAEKYDTTVSAIKELNPALLKDSTPPYKYILRLPSH